jgi:hypothetical protein
MIEFNPSDFVSLDEFSQRWRFADALHGYVAPDVERRIRPLSVARAAQVGADALARHSAREHPKRQGVEFDSAHDPSATRTWLRALPVSPTTEVVVSWDAKTAALTDWEAFVAAWDDFCHASSDDVTVWAPGATWTLCYWHFGLLEFSSVPYAV